MERVLIVLAKAPVPGRVKTRLCPPATPEQAARLAAAALADTLAAAARVPATAVVVALDGELTVLMADGGDRLVPPGDAPVSWSRAGADAVTDR